MNFSKLKAHIIYTNLIVSISAGVLTSGFVHRWQIATLTVEMLYGFFAFGATLCIYNFQRLLKSNASGSTKWMIWVKEHRSYLTFLVLAGMFLSMFSFLAVIELKWITFIILLISLLLSIFYVVRIKDRNLRELPHIKIHAIAIVWVLVTLIFPLVNEGELTQENALFAGAHYIYFIAITIPFDIRDLKYDHPGQKTIPQLVGTTNAKILSVILLLSFALITMVLVPKLQTNGFFVSAIAVQLLLILMMKEGRGDVYCAGLIDGSIALLGIAYFV